jgi:hypothetical protein
MRVTRPSKGSYPRCRNLSKTEIGTGARLRTYADFNSSMEDQRGVWCWLLRYDEQSLDSVAPSLGLIDGMPVTLYYEDPGEEFEVDAILGQIADPGWNQIWMALPTWDSIQARQRLELQLALATSGVALGVERAEPPSTLDLLAQLPPAHAHIREQPVVEPQQLVDSLGPGPLGAPGREEPAQDAGRPSKGRTPALISNIYS